MRDPVRTDGHSLPCCCDKIKFHQKFSEFQYSETNVMHFSFSLLRIKGLYMFRALLAHPQEGLHKRHWVYCVRVMSVGYTRIGVELTSHTCNIPSAACEEPPEDEQLMLETCRGP
jgi:hypothetical protein